MTAPAMRVQRWQPAEKAAQEQSAACGTCGTRLVFDHEQATGRAIESCPRCRTTVYSAPYRGAAKQFDTKEHAEALAFRQGAIPVPATDGIARLEDFRRVDFGGPEIGRRVRAPNPLTPALPKPSKARPPRVCPGCGEEVKRTTKAGGNPTYHPACKPAQVATARRAPRTPAAPRTHCKRGHEFTPENTIIVVRGEHRERTCRTCRNEKKREGARLARVRAGAEPRRSSPWANRSETCKRGHPWTPETTRYRPNNGIPTRLCRLCDEDNRRRRREAARAGRPPKRRGRPWGETCPHGHPRTPENTYTRIRAGGRVVRSCRPCQYAKTKLWKAAKRAAEAAHG